MTEREIEIESEQIRINPAARSRVLKEQARAKEKGHTPSLKDVASALILSAPEPKFEQAQEK